MRLAPVDAELRIGLAEVCDATPYLLRAAKFHGAPSSVTCPMCRKEPLTPDAAMSSRIVNTGGFYTYMARGLGRPPAVAGGLVAVIAYNAVTVGLAGAFGYFAHLIASAHGLNLPWEVWTGAAVLVMAVTGYRQIDISARLLSVLMIGEVAVLALLDGAIVARHGIHALPAASFVMVSKHR